MLPRLLYALAFTVLLPAALAAWALALDRRLVLPAVHHPVGWLVFALGLAFMFAAMLCLWRFGGGLPMNAFPPRRLVTQGPYAIAAHPIYVGFVIAVLGLSTALASPAGFWIITPAAALMCSALVLGYEQESTRRLFGTPPTRPLFFLPPDTPALATPRDALGVAIAVFLPWLVLYESIGHLPVPGAVEAFLPFERDWPVLAWTESIYLLAYPIALLAPLACRTCADLRRFGQAAAVGTFLGMLSYLIIPLVAPPRPVAGGGLWATLLELERAQGLDGRAAFPSFHVFWVILGAWTMSRRSRHFAPAVWLLAAAITASCVTTGMHALADLAAGALLAVIAIRWRCFVSLAVRAAERLANSWHERRLGPIRVINHGFYAGLAACVGFAIAGSRLPPPALPYLAGVSLSALAAAALWGQAFVGRPNSLRPFGYYGSVLGALAGLGASAVVGVLGWEAAGAVALAAPWVQAIGRLRCLVQGCCHGSPTDAWWAIHYRHPRSRVCRASGLADRPVHPTPLYSIAGNIVIGLLLIRAATIGAPAAFLVGMYLFTAGLLRFVEEHFRGEPHTPMLAGLRLYQWFAAASVAVGMLISALDSPALCSDSALSAPLVGWSLLMGFIYFVAMGVDAPDSNRRFARLT